jgi:hypothetical protein
MVDMSSGVVKQICSGNNMCVAGKGNQTYGYRKSPVEDISLCRHGHGNPLQACEHLKFTCVVIRQSHENMFLMCECVQCMRAATLRVCLCVGWMHSGIGVNNVPKFGRPDTWSTECGVYLRWEVMGNCGPRRPISRSPSSTRIIWSSGEMHFHTTPTVKKPHVTNNSVACRNIFVCFIHVALIKRHNQNLIQGWVDCPSGS